MKILAVDIGTGTQDILLYDSQVNIENGFKLVLSAPTMIVHKKIRAATKRGEKILLNGVTMGGGPCHWAAKDHLEAGYEVYITPNAAKTFDDDLDAVREMGFELVSEDESKSLPDSVVSLSLLDFDFLAIANVFRDFGVNLDDLSAVSVAVFDHGNAPPKYSDRQFRFDYLEKQIAGSDALSAFAFLEEDIPEIMTRMKAVATTADGFDVPLIVMDTAPAAVLGASLDSNVIGRKEKLIANIGNFHTLAFRLNGGGIEGVFEHHTGLLDQEKLNALLKTLADGSIKHKDVFEDHGHGAMVLTDIPYEFKDDRYDLIVTGPRRSMLRGSLLNPYFATPFGDMMIAGCFGLLSATGDLLPELKSEISDSLLVKTEGKPPWELGA